MKNKISFLFFGLLLSQQLTSQSIEKLDPGTIVQIENMINDYIPQLTGLSVGIIYDGEIAYAKGFGDKNADGDPFTIYTKTPIASVSKTITAVMAMRMIQENDFSLNQQVMDYFPGQADFLDMTIRHLLTHQSGIAHYCSCPDGYDGAWNPYASQDVVIGCNNCFETPGTGTLYTTFGTTLLGVIIHQQGLSSYGKGYTTLYQDWIRGPAGLSSLEPAHDDSDPALAQPHYENGDPNFFSFDDIGWKLPAGGFISNVLDLAKFGIGVMNNEFIDQQTFNLMIIPQTSSGTADELCCELDGNSGWCLGWRHGGGFENQNFRIVHTGLNDHGYSSYFILYPNRNAGLVLLANEKDEVNVLRDIRNDLQNIILCPGVRSFPEEINWTAPNEFSASSLIYLWDGIDNNTQFTFDAPEIRLIPGVHYPPGRNVVLKSNGCTY